VRHKFEKTLEADAIVHVSAVATFELWYGAEKSEQKQTAPEYKLFYPGRFHSLPLMTKTPGQQELFAPFWSPLAVRLAPTIC
jgi:hypothetical protein